MTGVLIGDGGHARDIMATLNPFHWTQVAHHTHLDDDTVSYIIGINDPQLRAGVAAQLNGLEQSWVHPHAYIGPDCHHKIGTHINYAVSMTRTRIGSHCTIAPGVTICGDVVIGDRVFVGAGAVIVNLTTVPDDTFIKAGTVYH